MLSVLSSFLLIIHLPRAPQILQNIFPHYVPPKFQLYLSDVPYKSLSCFDCLQDFVFAYMFFQRNSQYPTVEPILSLFQDTSLFVRRLSSIHTFMKLLSLSLCVYSFGRVGFILFASNVCQWKSLNKRLCYENTHINLLSSQI